VVAQNEIPTLLAHLKHMIATQGLLLDAVRAGYAADGTVSLSQRLWTLPRTGLVLVDGQPWSFMRHGGGILFEEQQSRRKIDVHNYLDSPDVFDVWRCGTYFGSLGRAGVKMISRALGKRGIRMHDAIAILLEDLAEEGLLEKRGIVFRMVPSP
jgi:hypothetical protein